MERLYALLSNPPSTLDEFSARLKEVSNDVGRGLTPEIFDAALSILSNAPNDRQVIAVFELSISPLRVAAATKQLTLAWSWAVRSLLSSPDGMSAQVSSASVARLIELAEESVQIRDSLLEWALPFFWLCTKTNDLDGVAEVVCWELITLGVAVLPDLLGVEAILAATDWAAHKRPHLLQSSKAIKSLFAEHRTLFKSAPGARIALAAATRAGDVLGLDVRDEAEFALSRYSEQLDPQERLQLLAVAISASAADAI